MKPNRMPEWADRLLWKLSAYRRFCMRRAAVRRLLASYQTAPTLTERPTPEGWCEHADIG